MKDKLGNSIIPGDIIAYGVRSGNSGDLKVGKVVKVMEEEVKVKSFHERYDGSLQIGKVGTLQYGDRIVVLNPSMMDDKYKALFNTITI